MKNKQAHNCFNIVNQECIQPILKNSKKIQNMLKRGTLKKTYRAVKLSPLNFDLDSIFINSEFQDIIYKDINFV